MKRWKISYIDDWSRGNVCTTYHEGNLSKEEIIEYFGLRNPDVSWFKVELEN